MEEILQIKGRIYNIQPFSIHDGPGIRTTVFLKGCNLRCFWCHNPESQDSRITMSFCAHKCIGCKECVKVCPVANEGKNALFTENCTLCGACVGVCYAEAIETLGKDVTVSEIVEKLEKDKDYFQVSGGGVTFSGGEPLLQAEFVAEVMKACKDLGIHTAVETAACVTWEKIEKILPYCDYFLCDLKSADAQKHKEAVGAGNELIIDNLRKLAKTGKTMEIRTPVIPGFNDTEEDIIAIRDIVRSFEGNISYSLLAFHNMCEGKYINQGRVFQAAGLEEPSKEKMEHLNQLIFQEDM